MDVEIEGPLTLCEVQSLRAFKVVNSKFKSICDYNDSLEQSGDDWSALYVQLSEEHAEASLGYRWDDPTCRSAALLCAALNKNARILKICGRWAANGGITGVVKAELLKRQLGMDAALPLMQQVPPGTAFLIPEVCGDDHDWVELVIPHSNVRSILDCTHEGEVVRTYSRPKWI